jgi:hypothetical protein
MRKNNDATKFFAGHLNAMRDLINLNPDRIGVVLRSQHHEVMNRDSNWKYLVYQKWSSQILLGFV